MLYSLARNVLFQLDPERAHGLAMASLNQAAHCGLVKPGTATVAQPRTVMGLSFPNPLGIAAGLDKNGEYLDGLAALGVGFVEVGTVTPRPQPGNPKPRLFRLPEVEGIINRMGFNNHGVANLLRQVAAARYRGILGINIGKNFDTPIERANEDYITALRAVYTAASYVTVNISSPNTKHLRDLQSEAALAGLLSAIKQTQQALTDQHGRYVPIALKIAPDLEPDQLEAIARLLVNHRMDAVIATNTTIARSAIAGQALAHETGGLSGAPLFEQSLAVVRSLSRLLDGAVPIIGVGGITTPARAQAMLAAGASLIQLYSGLIFKGPQLVTDILEALSRDGVAG